MWTKRSTDLSRIDEIWWFTECIGFSHHGFKNKFWGTDLLPYQPLAKYPPDLTLLILIHPQGQGALAWGKPK